MHSNTTLSKTCLNKIIEQYQNSFLTFIPHTCTDLSTPHSKPDILNDNDVNHLFKWAIFKVKKRYLKFKETSAHYKLTTCKLKNDR